MEKRTKIVCTIGPSSEKPEILAAMIKAGMNVARLNFSHGNYSEHKRLIKNIRKVSERLAQPIAILQDLQGPRLRVGKLADTGVKLDQGDKVVLINEDKIDYQLLVASADKILPIQDGHLLEAVKPGNKVFINDGLVELKVREVKKQTSIIVCKVIRGGTIFSFRGINLPNVKVKAGAITAKDRQDLRFGLRNGIDLVALSFVKDGHDVWELKKLIHQYSPGNRVKVVAKIERQEAVENFDQILKVADGIMVARGDLGIEMSPEEVPLVQKKIIGKCLAETKPVIVATQMLESMMVNPRPTRAEVSDIANAVIDHADAVMLSGETATGHFPVESVEIMARTIKQAEKSPYDDLEEVSHPVYESVAFGVADSLHHLVKKLKIKAIVGVTDSGHTARMIARFRPEVKILIMTEHLLVQRQLCLTWGVEGRVVKVSSNINKLIKQAVELAKKEGAVKNGDRIIIATAHPVGRQGSMNLVKVAEV